VIHKKKKYYSVKIRSLPFATLFSAIKRTVKIKYILIVLLFGILSCEKVIDVDLNDSNPEIVIEGNLSKFPLLAEVKLSKTRNYFGDSFGEKISGALVVIENELGESYELEEIDEGLYISFNIAPEQSMLYNLSVETGGEIYEASSTLQKRVRLDSLNSIYDNGFAFLDEGYIVRAYFTDPADIKNYYRIKIFENDILKNEYDDFMIFDDRLIDGQHLEITMRGNVFDIDDNVSIQLISLDKSAFEFYNTFRELININPSTAAPSNPISNLSNGALGYFSVWSSDIKSITISE